MQRIFSPPRGCSVIYITESAAGSTSFRAASARCFSVTDTRRSRRPPLSFLKCSAGKWELSPQKTFTSFLTGGEYSCAPAGFHSFGFQGLAPRIFRRIKMLLLILYRTGFHQKFQLSGKAERDHSDGSGTYRRQFCGS